MNLDFTGSTLFLVLLLFAAGLVCIIKGGDFLSTPPRGSRRPPVSPNSSSARPL